MSQYCTFVLDGRQYGIEVARVQEVIRRQPMTPVPLASSAIRGLINLRGQIVTALDLRRRVGLPDRPNSADAMHVVIQAPDGAVSLLVDEIGDVMDADPNAYEPPPDTLRGPMRALIRGAYKLPGSLLLILDPNRLIESSAARMLETTS